MVRSLRIISHRCRGYSEPENTLAAIKKALASPIDEIEVDLQLTSDHEFVVNHNRTFKDANRKRQDIHRISLKEAEANGLLSFRDLLKEFKEQGEGKRLNLDVKKAGAERRLIQLIKKYHLEKSVVIVSWITTVLEEVHTLAPQLALSYSFSPKFKVFEGTHYPARTAIFLPKLIRDGAVPLESVNLVSRLLPVTKSIIRRLNKRGLQVIVVNIDTKHGCERLIKLGATGTMTNNAPEVLAYR